MDELQLLPRQVCGEIHPCDLDLQVSFWDLNNSSRFQTCKLIASFLQVVKQVLWTKSHSFKPLKTWKRWAFSADVTSAPNWPRSKRRWPKRPTIGKCAPKRWQACDRCCWQVPISTKSSLWASRLSKWHSKSVSKIWGRKWCAKLVSPWLTCPNACDWKSTDFSRLWCKTSSTWFQTRPKSCPLPASWPCGSSFKTHIRKDSCPSFAPTSTPNRGTFEGIAASSWINCCTRGPLRPW